MTDFVNIPRETAINMAEECGIVPPVIWGRDHFKVLMYIGHVCVDCGGNLESSDPRKMRSYPASDRYPTRCADGLTVDGHDDWDCLNDFIQAGLVRQKDDGCLEMTESGWEVTKFLRQKKASGTNWSGVSIMLVLEVL